MKKRLFLYNGSLLAIILVAGALWLGNQNSTYVSFKMDKEISERQSTATFDEPETENPADRRQFEFNRLKNPKTGKIPDGINLKERAFLKSMQQATIAPVSRSNDQQMSESTQSSESVTSPFVNRGPFNIGGRTRALAVDVNNENIILAGGVSGGIWRSTDQGASWTRTSGLDQQPAISSLVQDRRAGKTDTWYYGTGEYFTGSSATTDGSNIYRGNGIYKSTDNGLTWSLIEPTAQSGTSGTDVIIGSGVFSFVDELAVDLSNSSQDEVYAATSGRIVRSTNGFVNGSVVLGSSNNQINQGDVALTSTGIVYATLGNTFDNGSSGQEGVWRSLDGLSWNDITPTSGLEAEYSRLELAIDPSNEDIVWLLGDQSLQRWDDATSSWTDFSDKLEISDPDNRDITTDFDTQGFYDQLVAVHPNNSDAVFIGGTNLFRSLDAFATTNEKRKVAGYGIQNHHPDQHRAVFFNSDPNKMLTGSDGGVHMTNDNLADGSSGSPITWIDLNNGYLTTQFYHADINNHDVGDPRIIGGMQDNGTFIVGSNDPTSAWGRADFGDGAWAAYTYNSFLTSSQNGWVTRFEVDIDNLNVDFNQDVEITPVSDSQREEEFLFINPFAYNEVNHDQVAIGGRGRVFFTNDVRTNPGSGDWFEISTQDLIDADANISALAFSTEPEGVLYMGTEVGNIVRIDNTQDIRGDVQATDLPFGDMPEGYIGAIKVDPSDAEHVIVTFTSYEVVSLWESTDGGQTWSSISGNLEENPDGSGRGPSIRSFDMMPDGNGGYYYFAGTSVGLFMTQVLDGDNTVWTQQGADVIGNVIVSWIRVRPIEGLVMVSTHANGTFTGQYDVGVSPTIYYSYNEGQEEYTLRASRSFDSQKPVAYQWERDGQIIDGENDATLVVSSGGVYQVRLFFSQDENGLSNSINLNIDSDAPEVTSINRLDPADEDTQNSSVIFQVTFNEQVQNVDASDFESTGNATGTASSVTEVTANLVYNVTLSDIAGSGTLGLSIVEGTDIIDETGNAFSGVIRSSETYSIVDGVAPTAAITRDDPTDAVTNRAEVTFLVEFNEAIVNFGLSDLEFASGSVSASFGNLRQVTEGLAYEVNIIDIEEDGLVGIQFSSAQDIEDESGNPFEGDVTTNETYTIENIITSIDERYFGSKGIVVDKNPSDGIFYLAFPESFVGDFDLGVVSVSGSVIQQEKIQSYNSSDQIKLDLSAQPDGIFVVRAKNENEELSVKLLKRSN